MLYSFQFPHCKTWRNSTRALAHSGMTSTRDGFIRSRLSFLSAQLCPFRRACTTQALCRQINHSGVSFKGCWERVSGCEEVCTRVLAWLWLPVQQQTLRQHKQPKDPCGVRRATDRSLGDTRVKGQTDRVAKLAIPWAGEGKGTKRAALGTV